MIWNQQDDNYLREFGRRIQQIMAERDEAWRLLVEEQPTIAELLRSRNLAFGADVDFATLQKLAEREAEVTRLREALEALLFYTTTHEHQHTGLAYAHGWRQSPEEAAEATRIRDIVRAALATTPDTSRTE